MTENKKGAKTATAQQSRAPTLPPRPPRERRARLSANYHPRIVEDFEFASKLCAINLPDRVERQIVLSELRSLLDPKHLGVDDQEGGMISGRYELMDISMHTLGLPDFAAAPTELVLIDHLRPEGIPPAHGNKPLPLPYCPIKLAGYLAAQGYEGSFIDTKIDFAEKQAVTSARQEVKLREASAVDKFLGDENLEAANEEAMWGGKEEITYSPLQDRIPVLPPSLRIKAKCQITNEFEKRSSFNTDIILHPAHPSNARRIAFIQACCKLTSFRTILSSFWVWACSWDFHHRLTPTVCMFIVISFLQRVEAIPPFQRLSLKDERSTNGSSQTYWTRQHLPSVPEPIYFRTGIPELPQFQRQEAKETIGMRVAQFFGHWAKEGPEGPQCKECVFSVRDGKTIPRSVSYLQPVLEMKKDFWGRLAKSNEAHFSGNLFGIQNVQSPIWQYQALVIEDPFVSQYNATHSVTRDLLLNLQRQAGNTFRLLSKGCSPLETLGQSVKELCAANCKSTSAGNGNNFFNVIPLEISVYERRRWTIQLVNEAVRKKYGRSFSVECFGSTRYGVDSAASDLDLVIVDQDRPLGFCYASNLPPIYNVRWVAENSGLRNAVAHLSKRAVEGSALKWLQDLGGHSERSRADRIQCDINVNDQLGIFNTQMSAHYCKLFPPLPALVLAIKRWAKSFGLNNPSGKGGTASFSSYALTIMTIGYLQTLGLLPSLQAGLHPLPPPPENPELDHEGAFWLRERDGLSKRCDRRFLRIESWVMPSGINTDTYSLLLGWFRYWAYQHPYATQLMSIRDGVILERASRTNKDDSKGKRKKNGRKAVEKVNNVDGSGAGGANTAAASREGKDPVPISQESHMSIDEVRHGNETLGVEDELEGGSDEESLNDEQASGATGTGDAHDDDGGDDDAADNSTVVDLAKGLQPRRWQSSILVVADPFILAKNVTGSLSARVIKRFKSDCRRAVFMLERGAAFEDLLGDGNPLAGRPRPIQRQKTSAAINSKPSKTKISKTTEQISVVPAHPKKKAPARK